MFMDHTGMLQSRDDMPEYYSRKLLQVARILFHQELLVHRREVCQSDQEIQETIHVKVRSRQICYANPADDQDF